jgi:hypothetical protein
MMINVGLFVGQDQGTFMEAAKAVPYVHEVYPLFPNTEDKFFKTLFIIKVRERDKADEVLETIKAFPSVEFVEVAPARTVQ